MLGNGAVTRLQQDYIPWESCYSIWRSGTRRITRGKIATSFSGSTSFSLLDPDCKCSFRNTDWLLLNIILRKIFFKQKWGGYTVTEHYWLIYAAVMVLFRIVLVQSFLFVCLWYTLLKSLCFVFLIPSWCILLYIRRPQMISCAGWVIPSVKVDINK